MASDKGIYSTGWPLEAPIISYHMQLQRICYLIVLYLSIKPGLIKYIDIWPSHRPKWSSKYEYSMYNHTVFGHTHPLFVQSG